MTTQSKKYVIDILIEKMFMSEESEPEKSQYVFAYTITIFNKGRQTTQLLRRHWWITNAEGKVMEVEGRGVVGEQPSIAPGSSYTYTSGTVLDTPVGTMHGYYEMLSDNGDIIQVDIPTFSLAVPSKLH